MKLQYAIKSPEEKAAAEEAAQNISVPPGLQGMADEEAVDESEWLLSGAGLLLWMHEDNRAL